MVVTTTHPLTSTHAAKVETASDKTLRALGLDDGATSDEQALRALGLGK